MRIRRLFAAAAMLVSVAVLPLLAATSASADDNPQCINGLQEYTCCAPNGACPLV